ncbi:DUF4198 domain-containing protein [Pseudoruegeria sp. HB172150]|uniref:DUF4198 domain-containing protein n=1 Tax=Pseudoruegeria sp. HB172150 TaxID=2721164 RepID=UPI00155649CC|nr:DUF4198 domain-containing protein [Pseudoruegeria sp. HB172150]
MRLFTVLLICLCPALPVAAHEFWISPEEYTLAPGESFKAEIRVGQDFKGPGYPYIPQNFARFELWTQDGVVPVEGRLGDMPALQMAAPGEGLVTVAHQTKDYLLTYQDWETFEEFVTDKDLGPVLVRHLERGFSRDLVRERYSRYGKSLVAVGNGAGEDREVGLLTEIVALANPYTDDLSGGMPVRVLYDGAPRADVQVELFAKTVDGTVTETKHRTDAEGVAVLPVAPGVEYLVNAVVMREVVPEGEDGPPWESLWASLTFRVPVE